MLKNWAEMYSQRKMCPTVDNVYGINIPNLLHTPGGLYVLVLKIQTCGHHIEACPFPPAHCVLDCQTPILITCLNMPYL